ncbi:SIR2 family protein [Clostridium estertheticum]|uniref:SIR2 family protein n=1 Tax=Clostridium estertheticum TaxID=238834 RepID=UPI001CF5CBBB|nr:SIR2 family protein [Clostridium estertheticum]MCB2356419.1 SIR2 family protein [Clostridium estertheticum]WAG39636.1 SIR2 family protein [Clostridium estertheticum]
MNEIVYDPSEFIRGLQQLLVSDKKRIAFLFGAGTSLSTKNSKSLNVPAIGKMTEIIEQKLNINKKIKRAIIEIKKELGIENYTIETLLSNLEIKKNIIGKGKLNGLNLADIENFLKQIKKEVRVLVSIHKGIIESGELKNVIHVDFAEWIGRADRKYPIEIFTTNYDYLFEVGLEEKKVPYYDGFSGSFRPFFNSDSVEDLDFTPQETKLWKIHGSLGWHIENNTVWRKDSDDEDILIYPSSLKYADSRKQPYASLMDRLSNYLKQPDSVLLTCGYSFGDQHINERILTALKSNTTAHVFVLLYDKVGKNKYSLTEDCELVKLAKENSKLSIYGIKSAVIGCKYGIWKLKREPDKYDTPNINLYFDEDGPLIDIEEINKEKKGEEYWTGEGELTIPDFKSFVMFLKSMIVENISKRKE